MRGFVSARSVAMLVAAKHESKLNGRNVDNTGGRNRGQPECRGFWPLCTIEPMVAVLRDKSHASPEYVSVSSQSDTERRNLRA